MSDDLIKKKEAREAVCKGCLKDWKICRHHWDCPMLTNLEKLPTVDRPQGEWIDKGWKGDWQFETDGRGNCWYEYECSECGFRNKGSKSNFCPNCGTRMRGANDEMS